MLYLRRHLGSRTLLTDRQTGESIVIKILDVEDGPYPTVVLGFIDDDHSFKIERLDERSKRSFRLHQPRAKAGA